MDLETFLVHHKNLCEEARAIMDAKSHDYGSEADVAANFKTGRLFGVSPTQSMLTRLGDKLQRIYSYEQKGVLKAEGLRDAILDSINYLTMIHAHLSEKSGDGR